MRFNRGREHKLSVGNVPLKRGEAECALKTDRGEVWFRNGESASTLSLVTIGGLLGDIVALGLAIVSLERSGLCNASSTETRLVEASDEFEVVDAGNRFLNSVSKQSTLSGVQGIGTSSGDLV